MSNPDPTPSHGPSTARQGALPACEVEDGSSGPIPCRWQADVAGNGLGSSFTITAPNVYVYDDGHTEVVHEDGTVSVIEASDEATPDTSTEGGGYGP